MSGGFDTNWLMSRTARQRAGKAASLPLDKPEGVTKEIAELHAPIIAECKRRGWRYVHSDPTRPTTVGEGVCDFIIYADAGRVFSIECKTRTGKLKDEQRIFIAWIEKLGHRADVITSMEEFYRIVDCST